jgi:hypothetical protein
MKKKRDSQRRGEITNHRTMEVGLVAFGRVRHEGELRYAENFPLYVFDIHLPRIAGGIFEYSQR